MRAWWWAFFLDMQWPWKFSSKPALLIICSQNCEVFKWSLQEKASHVPSQYSILVRENFCLNHYDLPHIQKFSSRLTNVILPTDFFKIFNVIGNIMLMLLFYFQFDVKFVASLTCWICWLRNYVIRWIVFEDCFHWFR